MRQLKITKSITNRESASLDKYLQEIGKEELISVEEEVELAQRIRKGDQEALERLTKANLRFVVSVAKQYQNQGLSLPDLINEGNLGLIKAAEKFDETRGFKFISYAVWWIRQSILQALAEQSRIVRLPLNQVGSLNKINKAFARFEQEHERTPSPEELAAELELPREKVTDTLRVAGRHISVDAPFADGEDKATISIWRIGINQHIEQRVILAISKWCIHRDMTTCNTQSISHFLTWELKLSCQLLGRWSTLVLLLETSESLVDLVERTYLVEWQTYDTRLLGQSLQNRLTNPPYCV